MWTCRDCGTENEDNFKFCWSCGHNKAQAEIPVEPPPKPKPKPVEKIPEVKEEPPVDDIDAPPVITRVNPRPKAQVQKVDDAEDILPMFSRVAGVEKDEPLTDKDNSPEKTGFIIAVRIAGLFLLYKFFIALPELIALVSSAMRENSEDISGMFTRTFLYSAAGILIYLVVGIYLIASGRILIWLLPDR